MKEIPLTQGQVAIVDDEDYSRVSSVSWHAKWNRGAKRWEAEHSEVVTGVRPKRFRRVTMPHFILGKPPAHQVVDHRNHNQLDNRRVNIRFATFTQNACNRRTQNRTTGFKGVEAKSGRFRAAITIQGKRIYLGYYQIAIDAAYAYNAVAKAHFGEFACLNLV